MATYLATLEAIRTSMSASYWLQRAAAELALRDPVDALHDANALARLAELRWRDIQRPANDELLRALIDMTKE